VPTLIDSALGRLAPERVDRRLDSWSRALVEYARIDLEVMGRELAPAEDGFIVMSNHQSHYDIPVLFRIFPRRLRMVAKAELFRIPIWGRAMREAGMIEVDRSDREAAIESLSRARAALQAGTNIWIAPEGTRSVSGVLADFKKGGFHLARELGARILPVSIDGTRRVLPSKGRRVANHQQVRVTLHEPVSASRDEATDALIQRVHALIASALTTDRP